MGYALGSLAGSAVVLGVTLVCTGLFLAPTITLEYTAVDEVADPGIKTESFALLNAMGQVGAATGSVLVGFLPRFVFVRTQRERKPYLADLTSPFALDLLRHILREAPECLVEEMAPGPDELWLRDERGRYTAELRVQFLRGVQADFLRTSTEVRT